MSENVFKKKFTSTYLVFTHFRDDKPSFFKFIYIFLTLAIYYDSCIISFFRKMFECFFVFFYTNMQ